MNIASFLLCLVFAAIGYVLHPMLLPKLVENDVVAESALSDSYKAEQKAKLAKQTSKPDDSKKPNEKTTPTPTPVKPEVAEKPEPTPVKPAPVAPKPAPKPPKAEVKLNDQEFINALQSSVKAGDVNEFKYEQVVDWKREGEQEIDGGTYDVGLVTYKAQTIFDEQQLQAKALIKDGKVVKWLWASTNPKMRYVRLDLYEKNSE